MVLATVRALEQKKSSEIEEEILSEANDKVVNTFVNLANTVRLQLSTPPAQSHFMVVAIFLITHEIEGKREYALVVGTNAEHGYIGGAICAERAAICRLRFYNNVEVLKVVVVTDSNDLVTPGPLCREFLMTVADSNTEIIMADHTGTITKCCPLQQFWPFPYQYRRFDKSMVVSGAKSFSKIAQEGTKAFLTEDKVHGEIVSKLLEAASEVNANDFDENLHPIRFSAAMVLDDLSTIVSWQLKGLEYGCTLDAISQLIYILEQQRKFNHPHKAIMIGLVDQFGVFHAPFAQARSLLTEHHYGDLKLVVHDNEGKIVITEVNKLLPTPEGLSLLSHDDFSH